MVGKRCRSLVLVISPKPSWCAFLRHIVWDDHIRIRKRALCRRMPLSHAGAALGVAGGDIRTRRILL